MEISSKSLASREVNWSGLIKERAPFVLTEEMAYCMGELGDEDDDKESDEKNKSKVMKKGRESKNFMFF